MKKLSYVLTALLLLTPLTACSGKPDAGDVEGVIKEFWSPCKLVKVTDVKKTNGIDHGNYYQMAISYKLELVQDVAIEDVWDTKDPKGSDSVEIATRLHQTRDYAEQRAISQQAAEMDAPLRAAQKRRRDFLDNNCPGPMAGSPQMRVLGFIEAFKDRHGQALMKGDSVVRVSEFDMVKTENGWMAQ